jgi:hypothetical protein
LMLWRRRTLDLLEIFSLHQHTSLPQVIFWAKFYCTFIDCNSSFRFHNSS